MGTLSNKYPNAQAVETALNKGVDAYDNMGQIELVYNGTDIRFNNEVVNFQQIVDYITTDARFCYMVYNNRVLLTSDMQLTGGTRYVFFETSTTDSGLSKNTVVKVYSADGTAISSISHSTIANENFNNKVSTIAPNDKNSTVHYPNNKAVTEITDELKEDLTELDSRLSESITEIYDELKTGESTNIYNDYAIGYVAVSTGVPTTNPIRGIYTNGLIKSGASVKNDDTNTYAIAAFRYRADGTFATYVNITAEETILAEGYDYRIYMYYKSKGLYTNITEVEAKELLKHIVIVSEGNSELLATNPNIHNIYDRLQIVESTINSSAIPNYYNENSYLSNKVDEINANMNSVGVDGESFVFITDPHWDLGNAKQSPKLIKEIFDKTKINGIICGGDIINEGEKNTMEKVFIDFVNAFKNINTPFPIAFGNHDSNANANNPQTEWFDRNTVFNLEYKQVLKDITFLAPSYDFSFIYDKAETKTRFLFIDTQKNGSVKWEAITPVSESFNSVPEGYKVIVIAHWILSNRTTPTTWGKRILDTIDAYNSRGTYTNDQTRTYNYANAKGNCVLVCCGHTHYDTQLVTDGGVPVLNTTCDNYNRSDSGLTRTKGTISEQAFDVVTINYANNNVNVVRIGSGTNRAFSSGVWS